MISAIAIWGSTPPARGQGVTEIIAISGNLAPEGNGTLSLFSAPVLNNAGQVAFRAALSGTSGGTADDDGIYLHNGAALVNRARENAAVPEGNGLFSSFAFVGNPEINASGQIAFMASLKNTSGGTADDSGIYLHNGTTLVNRARENAVVPEGNGLFGLFPVSNTALNDAGHVAIVADLKNTSGGTADDSGIYVHNGTALVNRARENAAVPEGNGLFGSFSSEPALNATGRIAFWAETLKNTSGGAADDSGVYLHNGSTLVNLVRENAVVPEGNGRFNNFGHPSLNAASQVAFYAGLRNTSGGEADNSGIYLHNGSTLVNIVRANADAPDGNGQFDFLFAPNQILNAAGQIAFSARLANTSGGESDNEGIYLHNGQTVVRIARENAAVPDGNGLFSSLTLIDLNNSGQVAFVANLKNTSGGTADDRGIYLANGFDILQVVREGQGLAGSTVVGLVQEFDAMLNDSGQLAYFANLANGSQLIARFSIPDIHWSNLASGTWSSGTNWTGGTIPTSFHNTLIDPAHGLTVLGSSQNRFVKTLTIGATTTGQATLDLNNGGDLTALDHILINPRGRINVGTGRVLTAQEVAVLNGGLLTGDGQVDAKITIFPGAELRAANGQRLNITGTFAHGNAGKIEAIDAEIEFGQLLINNASTGLIAGQDATFRFAALGGLNNSGSLALTFGVNNISGDIVNTASGKIIVAGGAHATFYDDVTQNGTLQVIKVGTTNSVAVFAGAFTGSGGSSGGGDIFFLGDLRPGNSPAIVNFDNNIGFGPTTKLDIELGGVTPGSQFDRLQVSGAATLDGMLDVSLINGFAPALGNSFEILRAEGGIFGAFSDVMLPELATGLLWNVVYSNFSVLLQVAPGLLGDYNEDGSVDAADYVVWRKTDGSQAGYDLWRSNFGRTAGSRATAGWAPPEGWSSSASIPEPAGIVMVLSASLAGLYRRRAS
jgi:hypothetical protein